MPKFIKNIIIFICSWFFLSIILKFIDSKPTKPPYQDVQMAEVFVKDHPKLKATWKQLQDGRIKITPRKGKPYYLKDGVVTR